MVAETAPISTPRSTDDCAVLSRNTRKSADQGRLAEAFAWYEKAIAVDKLNPAYGFDIYKMP